MTATRLPRSGNAALAAGALIQAVIGLEFILAGLNKIANPDFSTQFKTFVEGSPGASHGLLAPVMQALIVPHVALAADLVKFTELGAGIVLVVSAIEVARRRFAGRIGARSHTKPPWLLQAWPPVWPSVECHSPFSCWKADSCR